MTENERRRTGSTGRVVADGRQEPNRRGSPPGADDGDAEGAP